MSDVDSVAAVSGSYRAAASYPLSQSAAVKSASTPQAAGSVRQSSPLPTAQNASAAAQSGLPLSLLLSVTRPAGNNTQANTDYQDLETDLRSGNVSAAQQVYVRLQSDLLLTYSAPSAAAGSSAATGVLNQTA